MVNRPSTPEIITVNSEALQTQIRDLLPSQNGFGSELQASNVITPIIDLTAAAEGSGLPVSLQQAQAFGSQTTFNITNTTTNLANSPGFYRITASSSAFAASGAFSTNSFDISDGFGTKRIFQHTVYGDGGNSGTSLPVDYIVFLAAGETLSGTSSSTTAFIVGTYRQVATGDGTLVQPSGFPL
jgi:hypothetical protein